MANNQLVPTYESCNESFNELHGRKFGNSVDIFVEHSNRTKIFTDDNEKLWNNFIIIQKYWDVCVRDDVFDVTTSIEKYCTKIDDNLTTKFSQSGIKKSIDDIFKIAQNKTYILLLLHMLPLFKFFDFMSSLDINMLSNTHDNKILLTKKIQYMNDELLINDIKHFDDKKIQIRQEIQSIMVKNITVSDFPLLKTVAEKLSIHMDVMGADLF